MAVQYMVFTVIIIIIKVIRFTRWCPTSIRATVFMGQVQEQHYNNNKYLYCVLSVKQTAGEGKNPFITQNIICT